jgi:hypothetical protein
MGAQVTLFASVAVSFEEQVTVAHAQVATPNRIV